MARDREQFEDLALQVVKSRWGHHEPLASVEEDGRRWRLEHVEDELGGRGAAGPVFVPQREALHVLGRHRHAELSLDERVDEACDGEAEGERVDPGTALQDERCGLGHALDGVVRALEVRLGLADAEEFRGWMLLGRDEREAAVTGGVEGDYLRTDLGGDRGQAVGDPEIAGVVAGASPPFLAVLVRDVQAHERLDPASSPGVFHDDCDRVVDQSPGLFPAAGRGERHVTYDYVDATNWRGEQAVCPGVLNRKVWRGNRTRNGAVTRAQ